jgi:hypothetical protein
LFRKLCLALVALALVAAPLKAQQGIQFQPGEIFGNETAAARLGHAASIKSVLDRFNIANGGTSQWSFGQSTTPVSGVRFTISDNVTALAPMSGFTPTLLVGGADTTRGIVAIQTYATGNESSYLCFSTQGTAASPTSTVAGQFLCELFGHGYTTLGGTPGWQHNSGGGLVISATENYTATAQGSTVDIYATPTGGATTQLGLSVGATSSTFTGGITVGAPGAASGTSRGVAIRTATTGTGAGGSFQLMDDSFTVTLAVANASSLLGTAYDPTMLFYSGTSAYRFNGLTAGLLTSSSNGTVSITAAGQIAGTATNDSASAGKVGEYIFSEILSGSGVSLTSATAKDVTTISLTAGDWDVWGNVGFNPAGSTTATLYFGWISTTANTLPGVVPNKGAMVIQSQSFPAGAAQIMPVGRTRISVAGTTTISLGVQSTFAVSTMSAYGFIGARRVR